MAITHFKFPLKSKKEKKKIKFQHHTNKNPKPLIIRTQGRNNKKFEKMNLYETFQQALFVSLKREQNWNCASAEMLPMLRWKEVAAKWWWWERERERERGREGELQKWRRLKMISFIFSFYLHLTCPISKSKFEFQQWVNIAGLTEVKICNCFKLMW